MKKYLLISLLLVSFLVNQAQGDESRIRKLLKTTPSYTMINHHTTPKNEKNEGSESEHKMKVQSNRSENNNLEKMKKENVVSLVIENHDPDILEIDEMDYSTVMRKPPIHN